MNLTRCIILSISALIWLSQPAQAGFPKSHAGFDLYTGGGKLVSEIHESVSRFVIPNKSTAYEVLRQAGLSHTFILKIVKAALPFKNLARIAPKTPLAVYWNYEGVRYPTKIEFELGPVKRLVVAPKPDDFSDWAANMVKLPTTTKFITYRGIISSSFWRSAMDADLDEQQTILMANIFESLVDIAREVQRKDRWRLVVERPYVGNIPVNFGKIVAADIEVNGHTYSAVRFDNEDLTFDYYAPDGRSLKRMFLKSPIPFGRVTSKFSFARFHPVLKVRRPHLGVDYGASVGTPVRAVGDGVISFARYNGAGGKTIKIRHSRKYRTAYLHLSRFAKGVQPGTQVKMGQVIGYVGRTGRVTGPHLHFEFRIGGSVVDPLGVEFPSIDPVPEDLLPTFQQASQEFRNLLPEWPQPLT